MDLEMEVEKKEVNFINLKRESQDVFFEIKEVKDENEQVKAQIIKAENESKLQKELAKTLDVEL